MKIDDVIAVLPLVYEFWCGDLGKARNKNFLTFLISVLIMFLKTLTKNQVAKKREGGKRQRRVK